MCIRFNIAPRPGVIIAHHVITEPGFLIMILARKHFTRRNPSYRYPSNPDALRPRKLSTPGILLRLARRSPEALFSLAAHFYRRGYALARRQPGKSSLLSLAFGRDAAGHATQAAVCGSGEGRWRPAVAGPAVSLPPRGN